METSDHGYVDNRQMQLYHIHKPDRNTMTQNRMTYYKSEIQRIKNTIYSNQRQIDTVVGTRKYIDGHYYKKLNLELLSQVRLVSKYHLLRLFKRYYGLTPRQYLINKRIEKSKEFLQRGTSVTETCFAVGFESLGSFSVLFKNKTGSCPLTYQKRQLSRSRATSKFGTCNL